MKRFKDYLPRELQHVDLTKAPVWKRAASNMLNDLAEKIEELKKKLESNDEPWKAPDFKYSKPLPERIVVTESLGEGADGAENPK